MLVTGDSVLARLSALESATQGFITLTAGVGGIQTAKVVAFDALSNTVQHADCRTIQHAGMLIGIAIESASAGDPVRIQGIGAYTSSLLSFGQLGAVLLGYNGGLVFTPPVDAVFVQHVGVATATSVLDLMITPTAYIV